MGKDCKFSVSVFQLRPEDCAVKSSAAVLANPGNEVQTADNVSQTLYPVAEASAAILFHQKLCQPLIAERLFLIFLFHQLPRKPAAEITSAGQLLDLFR